MGEKNSFQKNLILSKRSVSQICVELIKTRWRTRKGKRKNDTFMSSTKEGNPPIAMKVKNEATYMSIAPRS